MRADFGRAFAVIGADLQSSDLWRRRYQGGEREEIEG